jgi:hypothetical protein
MAIYTNPLIFVKFVAAMAVISCVLCAYYVSVERDMDFVYGVIFSFYTFFLLKWIRPFAFLTLKDGRWLTR